VTNSPCPDCWHYILSTDLERVIFEIPYRKTEHLSGAVSLYQLTPAGYLLNWYTQRLVDLP
jgi:deoxycytidylate deaminase